MEGIGLRLRRIRREFFRRWPGAVWRLHRAVGALDRRVVSREHDRVTAYAGEGGLALVISRSRRQLRLYRCAEGASTLLRSYRVGVGRRDSRTRSGCFFIETMLEDPVWYVPPEPKAYGALAGTIVPADAPSNPIRRRWLGFDGLIGIHGTRARPLGIGSSDGCVLMRETDVIDLYSRVHCGVPVLDT